MINLQVFKQAMSVEENKIAYKTIDRNLDYTTNYEGFTLGLIIGSILNGIAELDTSIEEKKERIKEVVNRVHGTIEKLGLEENEETLLGIKTGVEASLIEDMMEAYERAQMEEDEEIQRPKMEKTEGYDGVEQEILNRIEYLATEKFQEQLANDEVETLDIAVIAVSLIIAEAINEGNGNKVQKTFSAIKTFLHEQFEIELDLIEKTICSIVNKKLVSSEISYVSGKFTITKKVDNNAKITRTTKRLLELTDMI